MLGELRVEPGSPTDLDSDRLANPEKAWKVRRSELDHRAPSLSGREID